MRYQQEINYIIHLLKCAVTNENPTLPTAELNWDVIFDLAKSHKIASTLYFSIMRLPKDFMSTIAHIDSYISLYKMNLILDANRSYELARLQALFNTQHIDYIFLKGSVLKTYYPDTSMRPMSDIDILFRGADFKTIDEIFTNLGYQILHKDAKDTAYINPINQVIIEMQPQLIDIGYTEWHQYLKGTWDKCTHQGHEYKMSLEDFYIYHMIHMAKHFKNGGIGLTHIMDVYIMHKNFTEIDWNYVSDQLSKIGLHKFYCVIRDLANYWFGNGISNKLSLKQIELITTYIFANSAFGSKQQRETNTIALREEHHFSLRKKIFPDITTMVNYYGEILNNHRYLLPYYWIRLNITRLFNYNKETKSGVANISSITESKISKAKEILDICGLK